MSHYDQQTGKIFHGKVLLSMTGSDSGSIQTMQPFAQTPSDGAFGIATQQKQEMPPDQRFHYFTASIIMEEKVFIR